MAENCIFNVFWQMKHFNDLKSEILSYHIAELLKS